MGIFSDNAPLYWVAGLQAIPLYPKQKNPSLTKWADYATEVISEEAKAQWLWAKAEGNIGLALGPMSDIVIIDIDTDDPTINQAIRTLLPPSPWERFGKKGSALAYRMGQSRTFQIKDAKGGMIVELLGAGRQVVLPPSIHPDTQLPYTATSDLFDPAVLAQLVTLPRDIEAIFRGALKHVGVKTTLGGHTKLLEWVSPGSRDIKMIQVAGLFASGVLRGDKTFRRAVDDMLAWGSSQVERVAGDDIDIYKGVSSIAKFLINDVVGRNQSLPVGWDEGLSEEEKKDLGLDKFTEIHTPWDFDRLKEHIKNEFMVHDVGSMGRRNAVDYILARMATATALGTLEENRLIEYIAATGQLGDKAGALKKQLKKLRESGITGEDQTQIAKALLADLEEIGAVRWVGNNFWQWQGSHWAKLSLGYIRKMVSDKYGHLQMAKKAGDHKGIIDIMCYQMATTLREVNDIGVNYANGFLDDQLVLRQHDPMYGCTYTLPYRYVPQPWGVREVKFSEQVVDDSGVGNVIKEWSETINWPEILPIGAPRFKAFVESCWGQDPDFVEKCRGLQEAIAVTMYGYGTKMQRAFCLIGPPKSGKSQMLKIVEHIIPKEMQCAIGPEGWGDKFLPAELHTKLLNICGELSERRKIDGTKFKEIISGDTITVQFKHQQPFRFEPLATHWFASNHTPRTEDTSEGFNRRWLLLTYNHITSDKEKVLEIGTLIAAEEREVIASWAVQSFPTVVKKKDFTLSASHWERIREIAASNNSLLHFVRDSRVLLIENTVMSKGTPIAELDLYNAYFTFAIASGAAKVVPLLIFRAKMRELGQLLGFTTVITTNAHGNQECFYQNLTFAKNSKGQPKTLN